MGGAVRSRSEKDVINLFIQAFSEDRLLAVKWLFHVRNIRGGVGERKTFRTILKWMGNNYPEIVSLNMPYVAQFGRFDDLFVLFDTKAGKDALQFIQIVLNTDIDKYYENKGISLLAKWLPSENASSNETRRLGAIVRKSLGYTPKQYRKTLTALREYLEVVEQKMSGNFWSEIVYEKVPSKANLTYRNAFKRHDNDRYNAFIASVVKGEKKINASALLPYEIIEKVQQSYTNDPTLNVLWDNQPNYLENNTKSILCVCDMSGSMAGRPMATALALGVYTAERNKGPFGGYFITFSEKPSLQRVSGANIYEKMRCIQNHSHLNTNLQKVFDMLLNTAISQNINDEDMPAQILVISDQEFDGPNIKGRTNLEAIKLKYSAAGYKTPQLVFWNVNSRKNNVAAQADERGVLMVSGSSPSVFKTLLSGTQYTPLDQVLETLNQEMYNVIKV